MALWYLVNNIRLGTLTRYAGEQIDDASESTAPILAVGGRLYPTSTPGLAAASVEAQAGRLRGAPPEESESLMNAAVDAWQAGGIAVVPTVAVAQPTGESLGDPGHSHSSSLVLALHETWNAPEAVGTVLGVILDTMAGPVPITVNPGHPRTLQATFLPGWTGGDLTVTGVDMLGNPTMEVFLSPGIGGGTVPGVVVFRSATDVSNGFVGAGGIAANIESGAEFYAGGFVGYALTIFASASVNGTYTGFGSADTITHKWSPAVPPNGVNIYEVFFVQAVAMPTSTDATGAGIIDPGHGHPLA